MQDAPPASGLHEPRPPPGQTRVGQNTANPECRPCASRAASSAGSVPRRSSPTTRAWGIPADHGRSNIVRPAPASCCRPTVLQRMAWRQHTATRSAEESATPSDESHTRREPSRYAQHPLDQKRPPRLRQRNLVIRPLRISSIGCLMSISAKTRAASGRVPPQREHGDAAAHRAQRRAPAPAPAAQHPHPPPHRQLGRGLPAPTPPGDLDALALQLRRSSPAERDWGGRLVGAAARAGPGGAAAGPCGRRWQR
jgi:hypothetical protein